MCGIAGFSLSANSTIKPRKLANALLTAIEDRGYMLRAMPIRMDHILVGTRLLA